MGLLTPREKEVLETSAESSSRAEVAEKLYISKHTVQAHLANIYYKMGVHSKIEAVIRALEEDEIHIRGVN